MFVPDDCIMSNTPVPMLAVEKPDMDESIDAQSTEKLLHSIANAQGMLCRLPLKIDSTLFLGILDEKEKLTFKIRQANDDAQTSFAVGMVLTNNFKKDYAQVHYCHLRKPTYANQPTQTNLRNVLKNLENAL